MTRVLAIADEVDPRAYSGVFDRAGPDLVVSCGDLPFDYLEFVVTTLRAPLVYVPGNHDPDVGSRRGRSPTAGFLTRHIAEGPGPRGCLNIDGRAVTIRGLRLAGLGGSPRYSNGPNQYTESEMRLRALKLAVGGLGRLTLTRARLDVLVTHAPPRGVGDDDDPCHRGFTSFHRLIGRLRPRVHIHGHIHPHGRKLYDHRLGSTSVLNAVGWRLIEVRR